MRKKRFSQRQIKERYVSFDLSEKITNGQTKKNMSFFSSSP